MFSVNTWSEMERQRRLISCRRGRGEMTALSVVQTRTCANRLSFIFW